MKTISIVLVFIFVILWDKIHHLFHSNNENRHRDNTSTYAHFSKVDTINYLLYPRLIFTHPIHITLHQGECLYIPSNWWHWVSTPRSAGAINFWFNEHMSKNPYVLPYNETIDLKPISNTQISVWNSDKSNDVYQDTFGNFVNSTGVNEYVITLENYNEVSNNKVLKDVLRDQVKPPNVIKDLSYDFNLWFSNGVHDTGLHRDDNDGVLCVLYGEKNIILYPPSDTPYLYAYPNPIKWLQNNAYDFRYNSFQNLGRITGKPSSHLLYETCKDYPNVISTISKFYKEFGSNRVVWGYKQQGKIRRWEFYVYQLDKSPCIFSFDVTLDITPVGKKIHLYYCNGNVGLPFWGHGTYIENKTMHDESKIFVIDSYVSFADNYVDYMNRLDYKDISDEFKYIILNTYNCYELCIHNKTQGQIFVQYMGLSRKDFIEFLLANKYDTSVVDHYIHNDYKINNEITIVYDIKTKHIIRTGFYGIV